VKETRKEEGIAVHLIAECGFSGEIYSQYSLFQGMMKDTEWRNTNGTYSLWKDQERIRMFLQEL
jgi:hypothetical protein